MIQKLKNIIEKLTARLVIYDCALNKACEIIANDNNEIDGLTAKDWKERLLDE